MIVLASSAVALWAYLTVARGQFWRAHERDDASDQPPAAWPRVVAVVPARDEAESIASEIRSRGTQVVVRPYPDRRLASQPRVSS